MGGIGNICRQRQTVATLKQGLELDELLGRQQLLKPGHTLGRQYLRGNDRFEIRQIALPSGASRPARPTVACRTRL
jgi:hypothetical protein